MWSGVARRVPERAAGVSRCVAGVLQAHQCGVECCGVMVVHVVWYMYGGGGMVWCVCTCTKPSGVVWVCSFAPPLLVGLVRRECYAMMSV